MAKHKWTLKQIAEKMGIPESDLSEIDIEDVGTLPGVKERYAQADQVSGLQAQLAEKGQQLQAAAQYFQQLQAQREQQYAAAGQQAPDWFNDPLLAPVGATIQAMQQQYVGATQQLAQRVDQMYREGSRLLDRMQRFIVKSENPDFDEEKVRKWAQENNYRGDWEESHRAYKAANLDTLMAEKVAAAKAEAMKEAQAKLNAPVTEMGGDGGTPPAMSEKPKSWDGAWAGLAGEFTKIAGGTDLGV